MTYYPIIIPTLNRYIHFRRCVESLANNTHADKTELIIGLDYPPSERYVEGYKQIKSYIPTIKGFGKVTVFERTENFGAIKNGSALLEYAFEQYDAIISTEDDNEFSPCFLDFMNKALNKYMYDDRVSCVEGENNIHYLNLISTNIMFAPTGGGRGLGLWKRKRGLLPIEDVGSGIEYAHRLIVSWDKSWRIYKMYPGMLKMLMDMITRGKEIWGDTLIGCCNIVEGLLQLRPRRSMVRNHGYDGSGLHSGTNPQYMHQILEYELESAKVFELDEIEVKCEHVIQKALYWHLLPENKIIAIFEVLKIAFRYLFLRATKV